MQYHREIASPGAHILTLRVELRGSDPPIWRRFEVADTMTLADLHYTLQIVMGWQNCHLHEFQISGQRYGVLADEDYALPTTEDENAFTLRTALKDSAATLVYRYDFGDDWTHDLIVEAVGNPEPGVQYPRCIDGAMRCPIEDSGGIGGYALILEALEEPGHEMHEEYRDWIPRDFDCAVFSMDRINSELDRIGWWRLLANEAGQYDELDEECVRASYESPVVELLDLGYKERQVDYLPLDIGMEHVPSLIQLVMDIRFHLNCWGDPTDEGPVHAARLLGKLRAAEAIEPLSWLLRTFRRLDADWLHEELPRSLAAIGPQALPALKAHLVDWRQATEGRISASEGLAMLGVQFPESRTECVEALAGQLARFPRQDEWFNGFLISALIDLKAAEAAPVIERAFMADAIEWTINGDWEEVQIELGLLDARITPRPNFQTRQPLSHASAKRAVAAKPPRPAKSKAKTRRMNEKKARQRNRRK